MSEQHDVPLCPACKQPDCDCSPELVAEATRRAEAGQDEVVVASDVVQTARIAKNAEKGKKQQDADLNWLMRHPQGRRVMWRLLEACGMYRNPAVEGGFDTNTTMFKSGQQNIGQFYLNEIVTKEPDAYGIMVRESSAAAKGQSA